MNYILGECAQYVRAHYVCMLYRYKLLGFSFIYALCLAITVVLSETTDGFEHSSPPKTHLTQRASEEERRGGE